MASLWVGDTQFVTYNHNYIVTFPLLFFSGLSPVPFLAYLIESLVVLWGEPLSIWEGP